MIQARNIFLKRLFCLHSLKEKKNQYIDRGKHLRNRVTYIFALMCAVVKDMNKDYGVDSIFVRNH